MIEHANQSLRSKSRSLAMFAAIRLASSFVSSVAAALRPGSSLYLVQLLSSSESMEINSLASLDFGSTRSNPSISL